MIGKSFDFLKYRFVCLAVSVAFLLAGVGAYVVKGGFRYNIDFAGGTELRISFEKIVKAADLRAAINEKGWTDNSIQSVGATGREFIVHIGGENEDLESSFRVDIDKAFPDNKMQVLNVDFVGAAVGKDIRWNAFISILLSLLLILLYVSIRSKYGYAIGAVVALGHDLLAVLVCLLLLNEPMSLNILAAVLTILGYSLNDTIVIFSRVRENLKKMSGVPTVDVVNTSINQTLKRTMLTSFSTLIAVGTFYLFGGEALRSFSLTMILGIIFGTYSSVYVAIPVMILLTSKNKVESSK